ncbi:MAG: uracil-DNA glycosylase [Saprospiraceae bacterium]|jgi:uracil-DNA glycosylase
MSQSDHVKIHESWKEVLKEEFDQAYFSAIKQAILNDSQAGKTIYPLDNQLFNAFDTTPFDQVKVVIIGQDPYHGPGQAHGLCFSVQEGVPAPPSLVNIFKELQADLGLEIPNSGNLQRWATQGVFLLNAALTVRKQEANSHKDIGWHKFTDAVIKKLSDEREGLVFLLWGGFAKKKVSLINGLKHHILLSGHPSPLSANRGYWFGNKHFSKTNKLLKKQGLEGIDW